MKKSKYEKYIVRKGVEHPAGAQVIFSSDLIADAKTKIEYIYISNDVEVGTGKDFPPHKHDYEEIFLFLSTDPKDTTTLGAEVEFWLGQGSDAEKLFFSTPSAIYVPPGVVHFPQIWKNVRRPVLLIVVMPTTGESKIEPALSRRTATMRRVVRAAQRRKGRGRAGKETGESWQKERK